MSTPTPQEEPTAIIKEKVDQLHHLLAAHEAAQVLKQHLADLAKEAPQFWEGAVSGAERASRQLREVIHDTGHVITGKHRPS